MISSLVLILALHYYTSNHNAKGQMLSFLMFIFEGFISLFDMVHHSNEMKDKNHDHLSKCRKNI